LFENKYQSLNQTDGSLWKTAKNVLRIKEQLPPMTDSAGSLAISDIEKANLFGKHLSKMFTPHVDIIPNSDHSETIEQFINSPLPMLLPAKHTSPNEISFLIKKLKDGKSPGHDLITNKVLKNLPRKPILLITFIFNAMLRLSYFSLIWNLSTVILIPKPNKPKTSHLLQADKLTSNSTKTVRKNNTQKNQTYKLCKHIQLSQTLNLALKQNIPLSTKFIG